MNVSQKNKEAIERSVLTLAKSFIDHDPMKKLLKFMEEEKENTKWQ